MDQQAFSEFVARVAAVCRIAAPRTMLTDLRNGFRNLGLTEAVARHDTPALFDWLICGLSLQGVSDAVAWSYMDRHGSVRFADIEEALETATCPKLRSYWHFADCCYAKQAFSCCHPELIEGRPLPRHDLRNGRLNQTAYSLFLFLRDVCGSDLVGWIDERLSEAGQGSAPDRLAHMRSALLEPLGCVYGVSSKVLSMNLADLLLAGDPDRTRWIEVGASMIAVDTLVHNWLHRTGSLQALGATHAYGPGCYGPHGCAALIDQASRAINAREFCPEGPVCFPRLIQSALWRFCAEGGLGICNGHRIDDRRPCHLADCPVGQRCLRLLLSPGS